MLEGYKAYLLPGVAVLLLVGYFVFRPSADVEPASDGAEASSTAPAARPPTRREQIEQAAAAAGGTAPPLPDAYQQTVAAAMAPLVDRCRTPRPADADVTLNARVDVTAAEAIGGFIKRFEVTGGGGSEGFTGCIQEGARNLRLPDAAATGHGTYALSLTP